MKLLLDTHTWLWMSSAPARLSPRVRKLVSSADHQRLLSAVSAWEIVLKHSKGKLRLPVDPAEYLPTRMAETVTDPLALWHRHVLQLSRLPFHHSDPFDRLLIAQAQIEGLPIVTVDPVFRQYDVEVIWS